MSEFHPEIFTSGKLVAGITQKVLEKSNEYSFQMTVAEYQDSQNLKDLCNRLGLDSNRVALTSQVHKADIFEVTKGGYYQNNDGLYTEEVNLLLGIRIADCASIIFYDSVRSAIGIVHAGWRGAVAHIHTKMIELFVSKGSLVQNITCWISPCIGTRQFEVGEEVAEEFPSEFVHRDIGIKPHIDLKGFLIQGLTAKGIRSEAIEVSPYCTVENNNEYFSHRAEDGKAGRMMVFAALVS